MARKIINRVVVKRSPVFVKTAPQEPREVHIPGWIIGLIIIIGIGIGGWYWFYRTDFFNIKEVMIQGETSNEAKIVLENIKGKNIFTLDMGQVQQEIKKVYPEAKSVKFYRGLPDTIKVVINIRRPAIIWQVGGKRYLVDRLGIAFKEAGESVGNNPIIEDRHGLPVKLGEQIISLRLINFINEFEKNYDIAGIKLVRWEMGDTSLHIIGRTDRGWKILFDASRAPKWQLEDLEKIVAKHKNDIKQYLDLRVPGFAYYK